jgi:hypothetical protein
MKQYKDLNEMKTQLTEQDIDSIISIIGARCRVKTINRLRSILTYSASSIGNYGIYGRLWKTDKGYWEYCAGQCYTSEIKTVRECILGKIY